MEKFIEVPSRPGEHIRKVANRAITVANACEMPAGFDFNEMFVYVEPGDLPDAVVKRFNEQCERRAAEYRASPAGIAAAEARKLQIAENQAKVESLFAELPGAAATDSDIIDWLCAYADPADDVDVIAPHAAVADRLENLGYKRGENVGRGDLANDREGMGRWIIGQAIDCLRRGMPPHPVLHTFRDKHRGIAA